MKDVRGSPLTINGGVEFKPFSNLTARLNSDEFSRSFNLNWQAAPNVFLFGNLYSQRAAEFGLQFSLAGKQYFTSASVTYDLENHLRWNFDQRLYRLEFLGFGNETGFYTKLNYSLSSAQDTNTGHALFLSYERSALQTLNERSGLHNANDFAAVGWQYRSPQTAVNGRIPWDVLVGYGIGSHGAGLIASLQREIVPGILIQGIYTGASTTSGEATFRLEVVSDLNFQHGIRPGDRNFDYFRTQGGIVIQPFLDANQNGRLDDHEKVYIDPNIGMLNNKPLKFFRSDFQPDRITLRLAPGTYRLDLDPAGFPPDWQATTDSYAIEVTAGSYTLVPIPLIRSYILSGVVTNRQGQPISGARVEAISPLSGKRLFSITNGAGVYYLERLQEGTYSLEISGSPAQPSVIKINSASKAYQELNLQQP